MRRFYCLIVVCIVAAGCGIKGRPHPPLAPSPVPVADAPEPMAEGLPTHDAPADPIDPYPDDEDEDEDLSDLLAPHDDDPF